MKPATAEAGAVAQPGGGFGRRDGADCGEQVEHGGADFVRAQFFAGAGCPIARGVEVVFSHVAANQVGVGLRLFVYGCPDDDGVRHVGHVVNPVPELPGSGSRRLVDDFEGRLSVPGAAMAVPRTDRAVVRGFDKDGNPLVVEGSGYFARCLQHETDHVLGHTYLDRLSKRDRRDALRQMEDRREDVFARRALKAAGLGR
ncbi:peptide deformylase [Streptomyces sp. TRM68367]|uniref:peptide deformylase n=1 Tax=Streptomyces sp. TRM68367 TaxID=2758415 RepID=UPI00165B1141|nr:peptide deformylase [Streptomyces sp. TRM68367]MBC9724396.1 peptide deformylase [Streptomyces sp. TRM68367]